MTTGFEVGVSGGSVRERKDLVERDADASRSEPWPSGQEGYLTQPAIGLEGIEILSNELSADHVQYPVGAPSPRTTSWKSCRLESIDTSAPSIFA